jgi:cytochrome b subunit of formate dehydrogenase
MHSDQNCTDNCVCGLEGFEIFWEEQVFNSHLLCSTFIYLRKCLTLFVTVCCILTIVYVHNFNIKIREEEKVELVGRPCHTEDTQNFGMKTKTSKFNNLLGRRIIFSWMLATLVVVLHIGVTVRTMKSHTVYFVAYTGLNLM